MSSSKNDIREGHYSISYKSPNNEFKHNSNKLETNQDGQIPEDNYLMVYFTFFLLGIATVLAWNVFTTASVYFHSRFIRTPFVDYFENYFSIIYVVPELLFLGYAIYFQKSGNMSRRINISLLSLVTIFMMVAITTQVNLFTPTGYFYFIIFLMFLSGIFTAYLQNGVFAVVSRFSPIYMQAVMSGQGLAGVIVSVFEIVSAITIENKKTPTDAELSQMAFACFLFSMFITLLSIITYFILTWSPLYRHYFPPQETLIIHPIDQTLSNHSLQSTFNRIQLLCFAIFYDFTITLGLYPSITAFITSTTPIQNRYLFQQDYLFIPIHFLIFNIFDWIGRSLPGFKSLVITSKYYLLIFSLFQTTFIILFLFSNVDVGMYGKRIVPLLITNDWIYFLMLSLFGFTNGYLASLCMVAGPQVFGVVKDLAGNLLNFFMIFGLVCGSLLSFPLRALSCGCNPFTAK
ncbi:Solute carrier family 29 equilibrative nucleoside transporter, member 1/2/3 [Gigaspora margarita]|uniref:Solute carrier family 29 equilibrative nucleoside transporter, member 1/2/3 n=1 Tax=Gigaspora margarita TaxID=4874 RepID=A0A8H4B2T6_GIGMA|nr:Solute carrier family 29 equilibrative nucleoside transporter, member 1/2/3 [Gigaspora margarita]